MNTAIGRNERQGYRKSGLIEFLAGSWRVLGALLAWLTGLGRLSDEELNAAGIYVGDPR